MRTAINFIKKNKNPNFRRFINNTAHILLIPLRVSIAARYLTPTIKSAFKWLFESQEASNFSYHLSKTNKNYLAHTISVVTGQPVDEIKGYISEIEMNENLSRHVASYIRNSSDNFTLGPLVAYGRRVGWYAFARAIKPEIVVETGAAQGLGSCIIVEALMKNFKEGKSGRYFGTDIMPDAGVLFTDDYKEYGEILFGDSIKSLRKFKNKIDLFINDSDHSSQYEKKEYQTIRPLLKESSIILGDNSHESEELCKFAEMTNRNFVFFKEQPKDHWYPGAGIGIAFAKYTKQPA